MSTLYIIGLGDSKANGLGGTYDRLGLPNPVAPGVLGAGYTTVVPTAVLAGGDGAGGHYTAYLLTGSSAGMVTLFPDISGTNYVDRTNVPTLTLSGGSPSTAADFNTVYAGGYFTQIEKQLIAAGYDVKFINVARGGSQIGNLPPGTNWQSDAGVAVVKHFGAANCLVYFSTGLNDAGSGVTESVWATTAAGLLSGYNTLGVKVVANKSCGVETSVGTGYTAAQITAVNSLMTQYNASLDTLQTNNSTTFQVISDEQALMSGHPEWFGTSADGGAGPSTGIHQNDAGNLVIANDAVTKLKAYISANFPASAPVPPTTAYNSAPSNEVSTLVGFVPVTPVITAFSGMSTFPNPQVSLTWGAGNWLRILVQMMTVGGAGTLGTFQTVLTIAEAIPGDATSVPTTIVLNNINLPAADAMAFGVQYKFRLIAQGG